MTICSKCKQDKQPEEYREKFHERKMADNANRRALEIRTTPDWCVVFILITIFKFFQQF